MLSLKNIAVKDSKYDITDFSDSVLRHFPDPHDRTPNDPLYFVSSDAVLKFANYLAQKHDVDTALSASTLTSTHVLLLRNYAKVVGWSDIHLAGRQLVLEASFERGGIDLSDTMTTYTGTTRLTVDLNGVDEVALTRNLSEVIPQMGDPRSQTYITDIAYAYNGTWLVGTREPKPMLHTGSMMLLRLDGGQMEFTYDTINHKLHVKRTAAEESTNAPDLHCFDVTWTVIVPTV